MPSLPFWQTDRWSRGEIQSVVVTALPFKRSYMEFSSFKALRGHLQLFWQMDHL
jgi:hypothetical protein